MHEGARYLVGIDLGTTNCAVTFVDTQESGRPVRLFRIPQHGKQGVLEHLSMLPSFHYLSTQEERRPLPWDGEEPASYSVGLWAREQGGRIPTRLVHSAKSWLSHPHAARRDHILPLEAAEEERRIAPVDAIKSYLVHIRKAWNARMAQKNPEFELQEQECVVTVPASFDEVARSLTAQAARDAGLGKLTLLEEPQAAFYAWLMEHERTWEERLPRGSSVLVCDVGGGTSDFSLIEVQEGFERRAVGRHLLLGGDTMDHALAQHLEKKNQVSLDASQWIELLLEARAAKEALLAGQKTCSFRISGRGSSLVGGGVQFSVAYEELEELLIDRFFRLLTWDEAALPLPMVASSPLGLPYEREPAITKHLAHFLQSAGRRPTHILFNGGAMKPKLFQQRIEESLEVWGSAVVPLALGDLELAVARGAAYFAKARAGDGVRIGGGSARSYYLGIEVKSPSREKEKRALVLLPRGAEEGTRHCSGHTFHLLPNTPVSFELYSSHTRLGDRQGELVEIDEEQLQLLPPLHTVLRLGAKQQEAIPAELGIHLTELGTLSLWVASKTTPHKWELEFQLRDSSESIEGETLDATALEGAKKQLIEAFSISGKVKEVLSTLETHLSLPRVQWPPSLLRSLFDALLGQKDKTSLSSVFESRFWNLAGFFLRPGWGFPLDEFRIKELWKHFLPQFSTAGPIEVQIQRWICFRRIAGGLSKGQQLQLFHAWRSIKEKNPYANAERLRTLASLERVDHKHKEKLGEILLQEILTGKAAPAHYWALARIGARVILHGSAADILPRHVCHKWIEQLLGARDYDPLHMPFLLSQLSSKTEARAQCIDASLAEKVVDFLKAVPESAPFVERIYSFQPLTPRDKERVYGDALPLGLTLDLPNS